MTVKDCQCKPVQNRGFAGAVQAQDQDPHLAATEQVTEVAEQPTCKENIVRISRAIVRDNLG